MKDLQLELGRVPTRAEFMSAVKGGDYKLAKVGGYSVLLQAAGLPTYNDRRSAHKGNIFRASIEQRLETYQPQERSTPVKYTPTLCIPDTHFPFVDKRVLEAIYRFAEKHKPERVIQMGDLYDMYAASKFAKSLNQYVPQDEEALGRAGAEEMWKQIKAILPQAKCIQLLGNHDIRPMRATLSHLPALEHVVSKYLVELMSFDGVETIHDERQELILDGIQFIHGYTGAGKHMPHALMNTVIGHTHVGQVTYRAHQGETKWELSCGLAGDARSKAFSYTPQKIVNWHPGFGFIDEYGPRFIPL